MHRLTSAIADPYATSSISARLRRRRWAVFTARFPRLSEMSVVDLGGDARSWQTAPVKPRRLVLLNTFHQPVSEPWMEVVVGDACDLPARLRTHHFDLVYSNSVLEHVGGFARRCAFAETARELGEHLWIQTPYRYFPLEPHWLFPFFQLLPLALRAQVTLHWPIGHWGRLRNFDQAVWWSASVELLAATELAYQFPDAEIKRERVGGLTKSLIAVR